MSPNKQQPCRTIPDSLPDKALPGKVHKALQHSSC